MIRIVIPAFFLACVSMSFGQQRLMDEMQSQEEALYASNKQINQFVRRFNGEEDEQGERYFPDNRRYRNEALRKKYIPALFDQETSSFNRAWVEEFARVVTDKQQPLFIDLHQTEWFAEVAAVFTYKGRTTSLLLFMELRPQGQGFEWVIADVAFDDFSSHFSKDTSKTKPFIHPMSHELEFMTLRKELAKENPEDYTPDGFEPDFLTLFVFEMKNGNLRFQTVKNVKFHFFGLPGWYFEVSRYNRPGNNTGWLISNLVKAGPSEKTQLKNYLYAK